jgi:hypothetical protein
MLGVNVLSDLEVHALTIPTLTEWGSTTFQTILKTPTSDIKHLRKRQLPALCMKHESARSHVAEIQTILQRDVAPNMYSIEDWKTPMDTRVKESVEQILWKPESFGAFLNDKRPVVDGMVFWKTILLPLIAVVLPVLAVIVPFFLLRFLYGTECVSVEQYTCHVKSVLLKQISIPDVLRSRGDGDVFGTVVEYLFLGITVFTFLSSIWSQITAALHLRQIAIDIRRRGDSILTILTSIDGILAQLNDMPVRLRRGLHPIIEEGEQLVQSLRSIPRCGGLATYAHVWNDATVLKHVDTWLGHIDVLQAISALPSICFPRYTGSLCARGLHHPRLSDGGVRNDAILNKDKSAVLLTGPNRGGKSTFCKSLGLSILCAQTWGFAFAASMDFAPFDHIETALHPADTLGALSLFESEIEFAKHVLAVPRDSRLFVMMDEIFHSTNSRDGLAASRVFLSQLFERPNTTSVISTHYIELATDFSDKATPWAMDVGEHEDGRLLYTYRVIPGVSDKSSVMEILEERGLACGTPSARFKSGKDSEDTNQRSET